MPKKIPIFLFPLILPSIISILFKVTGKKKEYCFYKYGIEGKETLYFSFAVSADKKQTIKVNVKNHNTNQTFYNKDHVMSDSVKIKEEVNGYKNYDICFYPDIDEKFYISFELYSPGDDKGTKNLGTDKQMKSMTKGIKDITSSFQNIQSNARQINDRRFRHNKILNGIIESIETLTLVKIGIVALLSLLQIYAITKFFGDDKRVTSVKGAFATEKL